MKKVIIIGAGPAGITAGYELLKQSGGEYEVKILEESPYIGGISRTEVYNGHRMDIGGHRFFSKSQEVNDWWENIMPAQGAPAYDDDQVGRNVPLVKGGPDPAKTDRVMLHRNRISHIYYKRKFFEYPVKMNMDTFKNMGFGTTMQAGFSYLGSMVSKKPENSLENFYINQFGKKLYSMFFEGYTEKLWGRHPREIDPSWGAQRTKGLSITEIVKDATMKVFHKDAKSSNTSLIESFKYPKLGPGQLWETAAAEFENMGGTIHTNCQVLRVNTVGNKVESVICAVDGITVEEKADIVISSMPIKDLILGMNAVPQEISQIARKLPYRDFVTVGLLVPKLRINNTTYVRTLGNVIPDTWIYVQDVGVKMGRIQIFNNWSPYLLEKPEKTVWVGLEYFCNEGDRDWNMTDEEWIAFATKELIQMGILSESAKVLDAHKVAVKKAYPAYFDSYSRFGEVREYLDNFENLYCVGRNGQHRYNNMDHSMITSFEAVKNILNGVKDKSNIWNVNTEQEYHEEKKAENKANAINKQELTAAQTIVATPVMEQSGTTSTVAVEEQKSEGVSNVQEPVSEVGVATPVQESIAPAKTEAVPMATVQEVPTPPVNRRIPIRRHPVKKEAELVVSEEAKAVVQEQPVVAEAVVSPVEETKISGSIWDEVASAEAMVKTAPVKVNVAETNDEAAKKEQNVTEPAIISEPEPVVETMEISESAPVVETMEISEPEPVVETTKTSEPAPEKVQSNDSVTSEVQEALKAEVPVETIQEDVIPVNSVAEAVVLAAPVEEEVENISETIVAEQLVLEAVTVTEDKTEEQSKKKPVRRRKKTEETAVVEDKVEVKEEKKPGRNAKTSTTKETKEKQVKTVADDSKDKVEETKVAEETKEIEEGKAKEKKPRGSKGKDKEQKETNRKEDIKAEVAEEAEQSEKKSRNSRAKKDENTRPMTIPSYRESSARAAERANADRRTSSRRKEKESPEKKQNSNIGKEAVVGNMKGKVIKANVIQTSGDNDEKSSSGKTRRK